MNQEFMTLLGLRRLPGRLTSEQAAPLLGFKPHELPILARMKLLRALGSPPKQAVKHFAASEVERCARDEAWLNRATRAVYNYWEEQNAKRRSIRGGSKAKDLIPAENGGKHKHENN